MVTYSSQKGGISVANLYEYIGDVEQQMDGILTDSVNLKMVEVISVQ